MDQDMRGLQGSRQREKRKKNFHEDEIEVPPLVQDEEAARPSAHKSGEPSWEAGDVFFHIFTIWKLQKSGNYRNLAIIEIWQLQKSGTFHKMAIVRGENRAGQVSLS